MIQRSDSPHAKLQHCDGGDVMSQYVAGQKEANMACVSRGDTHTSSGYIESSIKRKRPRAMVAVS